MIYFYEKNRKITEKHMEENDTNISALPGICWHTSIICTKRSIIFIQNQQIEYQQIKYKNTNCSIRVVEVFFLIWLKIFNFE